MRMVELRLTVAEAENVLLGLDRLECEAAMRNTRRCPTTPVDTAAEKVRAELGRAHRSATDFRRC